MTSMTFKKRVFYAPNTVKYKELIEVNRNIADLLTIAWNAESDVNECWIGSTIQIKERNSYIEIWMENGDLDTLISHVVQFNKELMLRDIAKRFNISLFDLRYKK